MKKKLLDTEDEINRLLDLLTLLSMSAGALHEDQSRALSAGLDVAITIVIDTQTRLADIRSAEAA